MRATPPFYVDGAKLISIPTQSGKTQYNFPDDPFLSEVEVYGMYIEPYYGVRGNIDYPFITLVDHQHRIIHKNLPTPWPFMTGSSHSGNVFTWKPRKFDFSKSTVFVPSPNDGNVAEMVVLYRTACDDFPPTANYVLDASTLLTITVKPNVNRYYFPDDPILSNHRIRGIYLHYDSLYSIQSASVHNQQLAYVTLIDEHNNELISYMALRPFMYSTYFQMRPRKYNFGKSHIYIPDVFLPSIGEKAVDLIIDYELPD